MEHDPNKFIANDSDRLRWLLVDLDGTLAGNVWPHRGIGEPLSKNVDKLRKAVEKGFKVIIYTARPWSDYRVIEKWLNHYDIPWKRILCGKPLAHRIIDDKAIHPDRKDWTK